MIPSDLGHRRAEYNEELIVSGMRINRLSDFGQAEHCHFGTAVQHRIQTMLDGRTQKKRKLRVIHA